MRPWWDYHDVRDDKDDYDVDDYDDDDDGGGGYSPHGQVRTDDDSASVASSVAPTNVPQPSPGWTLTPAQQVRPYHLLFLVNIG